MDRVFETFYTTKSDGTGLGLAVTRKIIEGHGGTLTLLSKVGTGMMVMDKLPCSGI